MQNYSSPQWQAAINKSRPAAAPANCKTTTNTHNLYEFNSLLPLKKPVNRHLSPTPPPAAALPAAPASTAPPARHAPPRPLAAADRSLPLRRGRLVGGLGDLLLLLLRDLLLLLLLLQQVPQGRLVRWALLLLLGALLLLLLLPALLPALRAPPVCARGG
jgi:hypothetical protein